MRGRELKHIMPRYITSTDNKSPSMRGRELKPRMCVLLALYPVALHARAGIETEKAGYFAGLYIVALHARAGIETPSLSLSLSFFGSPSMRGRELKHESINTTTIYARVALHARAGIETLLHFGQIPWSKVALHARAGIETSLRCYQMQADRSPSMRGRELKLIASAISAHAITSPSMRGRELKLLHLPA